jgi:hypothetical protein
VRGPVRVGARELQEESQVGLRMIDEGQRRVIPEMRKRGIRVMPGGDYGFAHNPHGRNAWDFELFQDKFGFEPAEILVAATRDGGAIMGMADELGLIKPGYIADLVLVDGDPLRDIRLFQDKNKLTLIMKEGRLHKRVRVHLVLFGETRFDDSGRRNDKEFGLVLLHQIERRLIREIAVVDRAESIFDGEADGG